MEEDKISIHHGGRQDLDKGYPEPRSKEKRYSFSRERRRSKVGVWMLRIEDYGMYMLYSLHDSVPSRIDEVTMVQLYI